MQIAVEKDGLRGPGEHDVDPVAPPGHQFALCPIDEARKAEPKRGGVGLGLRGVQRDAGRLHRGERPPFVEAGQEPGQVTHEAATWAFSQSAGGFGGQGPAADAERDDQRRVGRGNHDLWYGQVRCGPAEGGQHGALQSHPASGRFRPGELDHEGAVDHRASLEEAGIGGHDALVDGDRTPSQLGRHLRQRVAQRWH